MSKGGKVGQPADKWIKVKTELLTSGDFLDLINDQADKGYTQWNTRRGPDGEYTYFGNYGS